MYITDKKNQETLLLKKYIKYLNILFKKYNQTF